MSLNKNNIAVLTAFKLLSHKDYDIIIEMDGDGQHDPEEIILFIKKIEETGADIIAGSRILGSNYKKAPTPKGTVKSDGDHDI